MVAPAKDRSMKNWKDKLGGFFRAKGMPPEDRTSQEQAQSTWNHFVTHHVLPAFQEIKSSSERYDGTTIDIQQAPAGERWVRLTWMVAPSASTLALVPPSMRAAYPPRRRTVIGEYGECLNARRLPQGLRDLFRPINGDIFSSPGSKRRALTMPSSSPMEAHESRQSLEIYSRLSLAEAQPVYE